MAESDISALKRRKRSEGGTRPRGVLRTGKDHSVSDHPTPGGARPTGGKVAHRRPNINLMMADIFYSFDTLWIIARRGHSQ